MTNLLAKTALVLLCLFTDAVARDDGGGILVTTAWLSEHLNDPGVVVLHVAYARPEYDAGHIPGARLVPWQRIVTPPPPAGSGGLTSELPPVAQLDSVLESVGVSDQSQIVICGSLVSAARLFWTIEYLGFKGPLAVLDGGGDAWREEKRPLSTASPVIVRGTFTPHPRPDVVVDAGWVNAHLGTPNTRIVDARLPQYYVGADSGGMARSGHIRGAVNLPYTFLTKELSKYRERTTIRQLFDDAGVREADQVVAYCHVGQTASVVYFAARLMGHDARIYDGSFQDWAKRSELPVDTPIPPVTTP